MGKKHTNKKSRAGINPPFSGDPENLLLSPPFLMQRRSIVEPPVFWTCPPGEVSVYTENHSKQNNDTCHCDIRDFLIFDIFENQIKCCIENSCNNRIPGILVHHCKAENICNPLCGGESFSTCKAGKSIDKNTDIIWNDESFENSFFHKTFKIISF